MAKIHRVIQIKMNQFKKMPTYTYINTKNCSLSIVLTATDQKPQKSLKGDITQHHVDIQAM